MSRHSILLAGILLLLFCPLVFSQAPGGPAGGRPGSATGAALPGMPAPNAARQTGTARLRGRVVAAESGAPLRRAQVQAVAAANDVSSAWVIRQAVLHYLATRSGQSELPLGTDRP